MTTINNEQIIDNLYKKIVDFYNEIQMYNFENIINTLSNSNLDLINLNKKYHLLNTEILTTLNITKFKIETTSNNIYISTKEKAEKITEKNLLVIIDTNEEILNLNNQKIILENSLIYLKAIRHILDTVSLQN